jgi:hypothetical protein
MTAVVSSEKVAWFRTERFRRFVVAHAISYAIVTVFAMGVIPILLRLMPPEELWSATQQEATRAVEMRLIVPSIVVFVLAHLTVLPWMLFADAARGKKIFVALDVLLFAMSLFGGGAAWVLLLYK